MMPRYLLLLGLRIEKVVHYRDDNGHAVHQRNVCCVGQNCQSRRRARLHVAMDLAALQPEHFRDLIEQYTVGVAEDEKHRRFGGFEFVGAEVVWSQSHRFDVIEKIREFVRRRA